MKSVMFVWKSGILYEFRRFLYEISPCLHEFRPVGWVAVIMCAATVGWRNLRVAGRSAGGSGGVVGQNTARASSSPTCALEDAWPPEPFLVHQWQKHWWTKGSPIFWLPQARSKQPLPADSSPSFAVKFCHVLFWWTSKMPVHCTEHQDAFFLQNTCCD